jgi:hypothetical protein
MRTSQLAPLSIATLALALLGVSHASCNGGLPHAPTGNDAGAPVDAAPEHARVPYGGLPMPEAGTRTPVHAELVTSRVDTMQLMFAAGEMQTSGEPFANIFAGRNLSGYYRYYLPPDLYFTQSANGGLIGDSFVDLFGFSTAVESYEYSKYHMNMVANQTGAGVSLANGPLVASLPGASPFEKLRTRVQQLIVAAGTDVGGFARIPGGGGSDAGGDGGAFNPENDFGFPGLWPSMAPYRSFDPSMTPSTLIAHSCTTVSGYGGLLMYGSNPVPLFECFYNSLQLDDRAKQIEPVTGPGVLGYTTWKEAIWAIDFTGRLHDSGANLVTAVAPGDTSLVGRPGNTVLGVDPPTAKPGTFIGSTPLEGMWGLTMIEEMDNAGAWLLSSLATSDGATLSGFPSVLSAIQYDYTSPLVWFPTAIGVTENAATGPPGTPAASYPLVASIAIQDAASHAVDLAALAQGYSLFFGMTDSRNAAMGQQIGAQVAFGGYPFAADDGSADGESTPHDRALGVMRVAFVDLDRIHREPTTGVVVDTATASGGAIARGTTASTVSLGHVVIGLRHLLMGCNAAVSQYGAPDPDPAKDALGVLNGVPIHPPVAGAQPTFSARVRQLLMAQADFVHDTLTKPDGSVSNAATLAGGMWTATTEATTLEAQSAALRVLTEAWFLQGDVAGAKYQERARAVAQRLLTAFWSDPARMFRATLGGADDIVMTPERFAWLQQALRETYEALWVPGDPLLDRRVLEDRVARVDKLYLNGWDDLNGDQLVDKPGECLDGRLQMGEQALTGELGTESNGFVGSTGADRDSDCVPNISAAKVGALLAGQVHFHAP